MGNAMQVNKISGPETPAVAANPSGDQRAADFAAVLSSRAATRDGLGLAAEDNGALLGLAGVSLGDGQAEYRSSEYISSMMLLDMQRQLFALVQDSGSGSRDGATPALGALGNATSLPDLYGAYTQAGEALGLSATDSAALNALYPGLSGRVNSLGTAYGLAAPAYIGANGFCAPLGQDWQSAVTSEYGYRTDPVYGGSAFHRGLDIAANNGSPIRAALGGTVTQVGYDEYGYGKYVRLAHENGLTTMYAHCSAINVVEGQAVLGGDIIAAVGSTGKSTGSHLHFEVRVNGESVNPREFLLP